MWRELILAVVSSAKTKFTYLEVATQVKTVTISIQLRNTAKTLIIGTWPRLNYLKKSAISSHFQWRMITFVYSGACWSRMKINQLTVKRFIYIAFRNRLGSLWNHSQMTQKFAMYSLLVTVVLTVSCSIYNKTQSFLLM